MPNIQNLSYTLLAFEIFKIAQKTKKLALSSYPLGSCPGMPSVGQLGHTKYFLQS